VVERPIAQQMDTTTTTTPPTAQYFNSKHDVFCNLTVNLCPSRPLLHRTRPDASFVITTSTRPQVNTDLEHINKQATDTSAATHTVTSALNEAHCRHTEQATKIIAGRGPPPHPQCSIYCRRVIIGIQKQKRARKGLTSQRHRTVRKTISGGATVPKRRRKQF
jgi:hypothetical protein